MVYYNALLDLTCTHCGDFYHAERQSSEYCSGACRVAAHRARKRKRNALDVAGVDASRRFVDHKRTKRLDTIGGFSRDTETMLRRLFYDTNAEITERAIDTCWQMLVDLRCV